MSTRVKELIVVVGAIVFALVFYLRKVGGGETITFSTTESVIVIALLALSLLWIMILTIKGRLIERRIVFLYVGIAVALPLFMSISQKISISPEVRELYDAVLELPEGSKVLISFDYDPPSGPELQPMAEAVLRLCFQRDLKVIMMGLWPQGPQQANLAIERVFQEPEIAAKNLQYGVDYVNLGFQTGNEFVIQRMGSSFESMFSSDYEGTPYEEIPLVKNVRNFSNIDYSVNLSAGFPGSVEWVQIAVDRYGVRLGAGNTAVQAPQMYAYLDAGQLIGLMGGMSGAAEFETLTEYRGKGTIFMLSQSFAHVIVIAFVLIGNIAFIMGGRKSALKG
ncbi:MAG: hypothetical protein OEV49_13795 [candidate division Zixibacteria bacterium]|nr:hypothetical protein [candidate division Zixibacteria bacterium]MDH3937567.1 hypothetical protein [candidate division Zixibacteria bacterium]MDH4034265.1 hypothetical protein [candidate division Zixibacteria bacterium]